MPDFSDKKHFYENAIKPECLRSLGKSTHEWLTYSCLCTLKSSLTQKIAHIKFN